MNQEKLIYATGLSIKEAGEILSQKDPEAALQKKGINNWKRYLVLKEYEELKQSGQQKNPIIVIVAGIPCSGKTTLAREINARLLLGDVIGGDAFRSSLREYISEKENPAFFSSVYKAWQPFGANTPENIIKGYKLQAQVMNTAIERIVVDRCIRDGESMVFEYLHFLPNQYDPDTLNDVSVVPIVLSISEKEFLTRLKSRDTYSHLRGESDRLREAYPAYKLIQEELIKEANQHQIPVIPTESIENNLERALEIIFKRIEKLNQAADAEKASAKVQHKLVDKMQKQRSKYN